MTKPRLFRLALVAAAAALALAGCTLRGMAPPTPCQAWQGAEVAWGAACEYGRQQLAAERAAACVPLEPAPPPAPPQEDMPGEVPPRNPDAPPEAVPLPGREPPQ